MRLASPFRSLCSKEKLGHNWIRKFHFVFLSMHVYMLQQLIKSFEVAENLPVRAGRFVARKNWVVTGSVSLAYPISVAITYLHAHFVALIKLLIECMN